MHAQLCPKQVLGVRMALAAGEALGVLLPSRDNRLLTIVETVGCFVDGLAVVAGCSIGHRTLRVVDHGKVAATFVDTRSRRTIRIVPRPNVRDRAALYVPDALDRWHAQRDGYARMPVEELFVIQEVRLVEPLELVFVNDLPRLACDRCGEEVLDGRFEVRAGRPICRACDGQGYVVA